MRILESLQILVFSRFPYYVCSRLDGQKLSKHATGGVGPALAPNSKASEKPKLALSPDTAAHYLGNQSGWTLSNLSLNKILYLADLNFTGVHGRRLLTEDFQAWDYGPVLPSLYHQCKAFGSKAVPDIFWISEPIEDSSPEGEMLQRAWHALKKASPAQLVESTHVAHGAWANNYKPGVRGIDISTEDMIHEYQQRRDRKRLKSA